MTLEEFIEGLIAIDGVPNRVAIDILELLDGALRFGSPFIDGCSMAGSSFAPGRISLTLGMLIMEEDLEIQEMVQMEVQEAVQEARSRRLLWSRRSRRWSWR
jgi:hypothetical protein